MFYFNSKSIYSRHVTCIQIHCSLKRKVSPISSTFDRAPRICKLTEMGNPNRFPNQMNYATLNTVAVVMEGIVF